MSEARCAIHPDAPSVGTCTRCGNFACAECWPERELCVACSTAGHRPTAPVPWESGEWFGFLRTLGDVWRLRLFARLPDGSLARPAAFATLVWFPCIGAMFMLTVSEQIQPPAALAFAAVFCGLLAGTLALLVFALTAPSTHVLARSCGAKTKLRLTARACLYLQGLALLPAVVCVAVADYQWSAARTIAERAFADHVLEAAFFVALLIGAGGGASFARERLGIPARRAWIVGVGPASLLGFSTVWTVTHVHTLREATAYVVDTLGGLS